jgi:glycosyltransferase involved in cell wall biosynthesis
MNVLFITDDLSPCTSGIAVYSENVIQCLKKAGVQVTTFGPKGSPTADCFLPTICLASYYTKTDNRCCFPNLKLVKAILSKKYDVIHINCPQAFTGILVCTLAKIRKIKVVFFNHGNIAIYCKFHIKSSFLAKIAARVFVTLNYLPQLLFNPTIVQNPGCSDLRTLYKKAFNFKEGACGIDLELFKFSSTFEKYNLISVGRLSREKNWLRLLQLFACLPNHYRLTIIGSGGQEKELKTYCEKLRLGNVFFEGSVRQEQLSQYLQKAQAYISASLFETWGLTLTEALACGTPLVYPNHAPFITLYSKKLPEGCYRIDDERTFIEAVLRTEETTAEYRDKCRRIAQGFTWENATRQLLEIYRAS